MTAIAQPSPLDFFAKLKWLDGRPLLDTIEFYRRKIFLDALYTFDADGNPAYSLALCGRAKKNWKTSDLVLAALYRLLAWQSAAGNDGFILANDLGQAKDDLSLAEKIVNVNPTLKEDVTIRANAIVRNDNHGALQILPARDAVGAHGKTALFIGFDEIHGYKNHDLFEALAPDPTRADVMTWITSYACIRFAEGIPLYDFMQLGKAGTDARMYFSWYGGDFGTDAEFTCKETQEERANPSLNTTIKPAYFKQQKLRLPSTRYRRLHLNVPGSPEGAAYSSQSIDEAIQRGRKYLPYESGRRYVAFIDMAGGSNDDATLGIAYRDDKTKTGVLVRIDCQADKPPFDPGKAAKKFAGILKEYRLSEVMGDDYAGETFKQFFRDAGIIYRSVGKPKSDLYEEFEPHLNAGAVELLDVPKLEEQLMGLVWRGSKIDHDKGVNDHDDFANAAVGAIWRAMNKIPMTIHPDFVRLSMQRPNYRQSLMPSSTSIYPR